MFSRCASLQYVSRVRVSEAYQLADYHRMRARKELWDCKAHIALYLRLYVCTAHHTLPRNRAGAAEPRRDGHRHAHHARDKQTLACLGKTCDKQNLARRLPKAKDM